MPRLPPWVTGISSRRPCNLGHVGRSASKSTWHQASRLIGKAEQGAPRVRQLPTQQRRRQPTPEISLDQVPRSPDLAPRGHVPHAHDLHALVIRQRLTDGGFSEERLSSHRGQRELLKRLQDVQGIFATALPRIRGDSQRANENDGTQHLRKLRSRIFFTIRK